MNTYDNRASKGEATALVRRRINTTFAHERTEDLRDAFELRPIVLSSTSSFGTLYLDVVWGVFVQDEYRGYVSRSRSGRQQFLAYGHGMWQPYTDETPRDVLRTKVKVHRRRALEAQKRGFQTRAIAEDSLAEAARAQLGLFADATEGRFD